MPIKTSINMSKFRRDLKAELEVYKKDGLKGFPKADRIGIGEDVIDEMKSLIAKGISPIQGYGRFPGYKAAVAAKNFLKERSGLFKGDSDRYTRAVRKEVRKKADRMRKRGYPYSVMHQYPDKKVRPVNLRLSGDFLDKHLQARDQKKGLFIGFWHTKAVSMEEGHREGANGQGIRPIIPQGNETFTRIIYQRLLSSAKWRLVDWFETFSRHRK